MIFGHLGPFGDFDGFFWKANPSSKTPQRLNWDGSHFPSEPSGRVKWTFRDLL